MKLACIIIVLSSIVIATLGQSTEICACGNGRSILFKFESLRNHIIICGDKAEEDSLFYEVLIYDCIIDSVLIDQTNDATIASLVKVESNRIIHTSFHFAPIGDEWKFQALPFSETIFSIDDYYILSQEERFLFEYPEISSKQIKDINLICESLDAHRKLGLNLYPLEETSIYILFVGALKNIGNSKELLLNLDGFFILDGAIAETYNELALKTLFH